MVAVKTDCQLRHMSKQRLPIPAVDVERLLEEKKALEDALRPFAACVFDDNGDVTVSDVWRITAAQWNAARLAIRSMKE